MTTLQTLDWVIAREQSRQSPVLSGALIALSLFSWTLSEMLMAPALKSMIGLFWLVYTLGAFLFVFWFFRISRVFETGWTSYGDGVSVMAWALAPCHVLLPVALIFHGGGLPSSLAYEVSKIAVVLAVVQRIMTGLRQLNQWPLWAAVLLTLSPLAVGIVGLLVLFLLFGLGAVILLFGGLS